MAWEGSNRRERLPPNWEQIRKTVLRRDEYRCTHRNTYDERCEEAAIDVDHIRRGDDHRLENLRSLCEWHHDKKSGAEGAAAYWANRRRQQNKFKRTEAHPGLL